MATNKTLLLEQYNFDDPEANVKVVDRPVPDPGEGEVLVRVTLRPVRCVIVDMLFLIIQCFGFANVLSCDVIIADGTS